MANKKLTKADLKRMEDLAAKIASDKKAIATEKQKVNKMKKEFDGEKKKLATQWKELKNKQKQGQLDKTYKASLADKNSKKAGKGGGGNVKKLQEQLLQMKTKFNAEGKRARQFKQQVDQLKAENKVLQRKLKNLQGRKEKGEDPRIRNLLRENKMLKKQIKMLMIELNKKRRWFQRCIKSFKSSRQKWIKKQEDTFKKKGFLIRYVFLDDVKQIKQYKEKGGKKGKLKFKNKIKVKSRDGGVIVLKDVEIVVLDNEEDDDGDNGGKKGKKGKKNKKSKGDQLDEMDAFLQELEAEFEADQNALGTGDDYKDMDSDDDDFDMDEDVGDLEGDYTAEQLTLDSAASNVSAQSAGGASTGSKSPKSSGKKTPSGGKTPKKSSGKTPTKSDGKTSKSDYLGLPIQNSIDGADDAALAAQLVYLKKEMDDRTDDIEQIKEIVSDGDKYPDPVSEVKQFILNIGKRGEDIVHKLEDELHADQDDIDQMKANNDRWILWLNNLSMAMAKNGELFNELIGIYDYYIKELKGRINDLNVVNNIFYVDKKDENEGYDTLNKSVGERHEQVEGEFKDILEKKEEEEEDKNEEDNYDIENKEKEKLDGNTEKVKEIRDNLVSNNNDWRGLVEVVANDYNNSNQEKNKLVNGLNETKNELKELIDLIQKIPKRKILEEAENYDDGDD